MYAELAATFHHPFVTLLFALYLVSPYPRPFRSSQRLDRTERNRLSSKEMQAKKQKVWEALDSDLDGSPSPPASSSSSTLSSTASPSLSATALNGVEEKVSGGWGWGNGMSGNGGEKRI